MATHGHTLSVVGLEGDFTVNLVAGYLEHDETSTGAPDGAPVEVDVFKQAMRALAAGVVIVTTRVDGRPWGLTISSCTSLTLEPPQILVSLRASSVSCREILNARRFGVSILGEHQKELAQRGAAVGTAKFMDEAVLPGDDEPLRSPMIADALFHMDCSVSERHRIGDHELIVGYVHHGACADARGELRPLVYFDRRFWSTGAAL